MSCFSTAILRGKVKNSDGLSPDVKELLLQMDSLTLLLSTTFPEKFIQANDNPQTDKDISTKEADLGWKKTGKGFSDWRRVGVKSINVKVSKQFKTSVLREDDFLGDYTVLEEVAFSALRNRCLFSVDDIISFAPSDKILRELKLSEGQAMPTSYNTDFNMQTDESFSRIFFYGLGATLLVGQNLKKPAQGKANQELGPFVVDMMELGNLKTRPGFLKYGCRIHFSQDQMPTAIHYFKEGAGNSGKTIFRGKEGWERAKFVAKVNTIFLVTAREHLLWTHLILSNMATQASTLELRPSHPLRRLLTIFTFRTTEINTAAHGVLVPKFSILHRASGLDYDAMKQVFDHAFKTCNIYEPFPNRKVDPALRKLADNGKFPFLTEGNQFYQVVREFVVDWFKMAGDAAMNDKEAKAFYQSIQKSTVGQAYALPDFAKMDDMVNLVTQIIFVVTWYHELVGNVVDYTSKPDRAGLRVVENNGNETNQTVMDLQSFLLGAFISASTSLRMPSLMAPFPNYFGQGGAPLWERELWDGFNAKLRALSKIIKAVDAKRSVEYKYSDPARFECSVSV
ncbi:hypothetical protein ACA910_010332 [Epithemia clementina (nom. ined.)]